MKIVTNIKISITITLQLIKINKVSIDVVNDAKLMW